MNHWRKHFPSDHLCAGDLQGKDVPVKMEKIKVEEVMGDGGRKEKRPVLYFEGKKKGLVLGVTKCQQIARSHGGDMDKWPGKEITLYPTTCDAFGNPETECIRIRTPKRGSR